MSNNSKACLGFGGAPSRAGILCAPLVALENHEPHSSDYLSIEVDDDADTATIYLSEVDQASGYINVKRQSVTIPLGMLADLVRQRPEKPSNFKGASKKGRDQLSAA